MCDGLSMSHRDLENASNPRSALPSICFGPVQPFGVRSTIMGQSGRAWSAPRRARALMRRMSFQNGVERGGHELMHRPGITPFDEIGV